MKAEEAPPSGYEQQLSQFDDMEDVPQQHAEKEERQSVMQHGNTTMTTIEEVSGEGDESIPCYDLNMSAADQQIDLEYSADPGFRNSFADNMSSSSRGFQVPEKDFIAELGKIRQRDNLIQL